MADPRGLFLSQTPTEGTHMSMSWAWARCLDHDNVCLEGVTSVPIDSMQPYATVHLPSGDHELVPPQADGMGGD